jgi:DNA (cytosine-5)-methyltransferase 1
LLFENYNPYFENAIITSYMIPIFPVIDIFAGPGGLGEGFSAYIADGNPAFKIKLSIEKDKTAHETLELRAFYRQFPTDTVPSEYYEYLREENNMDKSTLFSKYPKESESAKKEAWKATLGEEDRALVKTRLDEALNGAPNWVLIGGPPCQAYSLVGRSRMIGEDRGKYETDPRHFLYKEYLHILAEHQPPVFVMENVKGLLSSQINQQKTFELILADLQNPSSAVGGKANPALSYKLFSISHENPENPEEIKPEEFIVHSEEYGIPQARHRIIILGIRSDIYKTKPKSLLKVENPVFIEDVIDDLPRLRSGLSKEDDSAEAWRDAIKEIENSKWVKSNHLGLGESVKSALRRVGAALDRGGRFIITNETPKEYKNWYFDKNLNGICNHETRAHIREDLHRYFFAAVFAREKKRSPTLSDFPKELLPNHGNVSYAQKNTKFNDRFRVQVIKRPSTTVVSHISKDGHYYIHYDPSQCRSLTVREAARLQTFPDNYFFEGNRTQQYHQVGNAVPPLLANKIAEIVYNVLKGSK